MVAAPAAAGAAPSAPAAPPAGVDIVGKPCAPGVGVTIVVDAQALDNKIRLGCAPGAQTNGVAALTNAGFTFNEKQSYNNAICQIGNLPVEGYPDCWYRGYWGYLKSNGTAAWSESQEGVAGSALPVDSIEGWSWTEPIPVDYAAVLPRLTVAEVTAMAASPDCTAIPQVPTFTVVANTETLPVRMADGLQAEVAVLTDGADPATATWTVASSIPLTGRTGTIRILARRAGTSCPNAPMFDATYEVRGAYPGRWSDTAGAGAPSAAVQKDSTAIKGWATGYTDYVAGGNVNTTYQTPQNAIGYNNGSLVVLGDRGRITLTFDTPITDGPGDDFAAYENGFVVGTASNQLDFLEFAYVEVSSNGTDFVRFDSASRRVATVGSFVGQRADEIGGLAGKDLAGYGTPFDLSVLKNKPEVRSGAVNLAKITSVRLIDIQGDGNDLDSFGRPIYDPNPSTGSAGYDLTGMAVLNQYVEPPAPQCTPDVDGSGGAAAALTWLGCDLQRNGGTYPGFGGSTDYGLTLDAVMDHALEGDADNPVAVTAADAVFDHVRSYTTGADFGSPDDRYAGALAKSLLAAELTERSTTADGLDLEAEVRARMQTSGADAGRFSDLSGWGDYSNGFGQALAILALSHTDDGIPAAAVTYLLAQQCPAGGFRGAYSTAGGCTADSDADTDYTGLAVSALRSAPQSSTVVAAMNKGADWLVDHQDTTGAISGTGLTAGANANSTGIAAQALRAVGRTAEADKAAGWIRTIQLDTANAGTTAPKELGAIAYNTAAFDDAVANGVPESGRDQFRRATAQAILAFDAPSYGLPGEPVVDPPTPLTADESWTTAAYTDLLGRAPSATELADTVARLGAGTKRTVVANELANSPEWVTTVVTRFYTDTLGRAPDTAGLTYWVNQLRTKRQTVAQVAGQFYSSNEYFKGKGGNTPTTWVKDLYTKLLHRNADSAGVAYWVGQIDAKGRAHVAISIYNSLESRRDRVQVLYTKLLGRTADAGGRDFWAGRVLKEGDITLAVNLVTSGEYGRRAVTRFP